MGGFVMIDKDVQQAEWYQDSNATRVFLHLAFNAFFADGTIYKRGQIRFSLSELSSRLSITERQVGTAINKLEKYGVISTETKRKRNEGTLFTIHKYVNFSANRVSNGLSNEMSNGLSNTKDAQDTKKEQVTRQNYKPMSNGLSNEMSNGLSNLIDNNINNNTCSSSRIGDQQNFSSLIDVIEFVKAKKQPEALLQMSEMTLIPVDELSRVLDEFAVANIDAEKRTLLVWGKYFTACKDGILTRLRQQQNGTIAKNSIGHVGNDANRNGYKGRGAYEPDKDCKYEGHFGD